MTTPSTLPFNTATAFFFAATTVRDLGALAESVEARRVVLKEMPKSEELRVLANPVGELSMTRDDGGDRMIVGAAMVQGS